MQKSLLFLYPKSMIVGFLDQDFLDIGNTYMVCLIMTVILWRQGFKGKKTRSAW